MTELEMALRDSLVSLPRGKTLMDFPWGYHWKEQCLIIRSRFLAGIKFIQPLWQVTGAIPHNTDSNNSCKVSNKPIDNRSYGAVATSFFQSWEIHLFPHQQFSSIAGDSPYYKGILLELDLPMGVTPTPGHPPRSLYGEVPSALPIGAENLSPRYGFPAAPWLSTPWLRHKGAAEPGHWKSSELGNGGTLWISLIHQ